MNVFPVRRLATGFVVLSIAVSLVAGCNEASAPPPPPPPQVTVAKPVERDVTEYLQFTGTTRPVASVEVRARVKGYLQSLHFQDGATVQKDDLLFVLEQAPFLTALAAAQADLKIAQAKLSQLQVSQADQIRQAEARARNSQAQAEYTSARLRRIETLARQNTSTQDELQEAVAQRDQAVSAYDESRLVWEVAQNTAGAMMEQAEAAVAAAQAAVDEAKLNLSYTEVKAPISGRIGRHMVDVGNLVQAETTLLSTIESYAPIHAYFYVAEDDLLKFLERWQTSNPASAGQEGLKVEMGLSEAGGYPYEGRIDFAELGVDPGTGTTMRRAVFQNTDRNLVPGLFVRLRLAVTEPQPRLLVSTRALGADQRGDYVLVVNAENKVEYRPVKLGVREDDMSVIEEGIQAGDRVVVNGLQKARPGSHVTPTQEDKVAAENSAPSEASAAERPAASNTSVAASK